MSLYQIKISEKAGELANCIPLEEAYLAGFIENILKKSDELNYNISGNIVVGLDVNGPIVACDDNNLNPFNCATECIKYMMSTPGIEVTLMTGWDLSTMDFFKRNKLHIPEIGIVGEYGMVYERHGNFRYLYPYREEERLEFMSAILKTAAPQNLKVAFQGNYSPGAGAICVEADVNGDLLQHPLVKGRRPSIRQIYDAAIKKSNIEIVDEKIVFENKPDNLKGLSEALYKIYPLISVRVKNVEGNKLSIHIDPKDQPDFNYESLKEFAKIAGEETQRKYIAYEDHGVDFISKEAEDGNFSKDAGLREYGREAFGNNDFISVIIGDKSSDVPRTLDNTLFFPLTGSDAEPIAREKNVPSLGAIDVRDFALALSEAHRIKQFRE